MKVTSMFALILFTGLLIVGCTGQSEQQPQVDTKTNEETIEAIVESLSTAPTSTAKSTTSSENSGLLVEELKENVNLKSVRDDLLQELDSTSLEAIAVEPATTFFINEEILQALNEQKKYLSSEKENTYTVFLDNEIDRLLVEIKRLENLGLRYHHDFPESGFPMEYEEEVLALADVLRSSIVSVQSLGGRGTGFAIGNDLVVTNEHVISGEGTGHRAEKISGVIVKTFSGDEFNAEVVGYDKDWDVALLRTEVSLEVDALVWGDSKKLNNGNPLFAIGHPSQMGNWALTAGVFVQAETLTLPPLRENYDTDSEFEADEVNYQKLMGDNFKEGDPGTKTTIQTTVPGMIGSSGSPILNVDGEVIALLWGAIGMETTTELDANSSLGSFKEPMPHVMHSVPVTVSREWTVGTPAWKVEDLIEKWLHID
ncbi:trypsin-like peptidase domain-containing protein [SAR202 cluster bacterium AC-409-J13_OGT_754m]|nr:trypsin-like peptidase domain-containing protein [SAR202 cluster bacterium AC-409-J13_OGT_754m]